MRPQIYICDPCYDGRPYREHIMSIQQLTNDGKVMPICSSLGDNHGIARARDDMVWEFLNRTDAGHFLCWDADIEADPWMVYRLLERDKPLICGPYAIKDPTPIPRFCCTGLKGEVCDPANNLQKVQEAGTGFKLIRREVIEKIIADHPELAYEDDTPSFYGVVKHAIFIDAVVDRRFLTEDYHFDLLARQAGFDIWFDCSFHVWHHGRCRFPTPEQMAYLKKKMTTAGGVEVGQTEEVQVAKV
jgi:hypothetical protein